MGDVGTKTTPPNNPIDFLRELCLQSQLLSSLRWLGDFQVPACIPLKQDVAFKDVADLVGVPESQLIRVVRMTATFGFLREPRSGYVAHSELSARFVTELSMLDALVFLYEIAAPSALHMSSATRQYGSSQQPCDSAYSLFSQSSQSTSALPEKESKKRRQLAAFDQCMASDKADKATSLLLSLGWANVGNGIIVDVGARSTEFANNLAQRFPSLRVAVQPWETDLSKDGSHKPSLSRQPSISPSASAISLRAIQPTFTDPWARSTERVTIQHRHLGIPQAVEAAAVYILRMPSPSPTLSSKMVLAQIAAELRAHLGVLRANTGATLILVACLVLEAGTLDPSVEALVRCRDLTLHQIANERELELQDLTDTINSVKDGHGGLLLVNKLIRKSNPIIALEIRFQPHSNLGTLAT